MKYINIECQRFSVASSSHSREESHIEMVVEIDSRQVISQFSAKEIVAEFDLTNLLDEIGLTMCLEHFAGPGGLCVDDFKMILERAK